VQLEPGVEPRVKPGAVVFHLTTKRSNLLSIIAKSFLVAINSAESLNASVSADRFSVWMTEWAACFIVKSLGAAAFCYDEPTRKMKNPASTHGKAQVNEY
jgi:hypothetical protein